MSGGRGTEMREHFERMWPEGYFEGDPLDPTATSTYGDFGFVSVLHLVYRVCIAPYVTADSTVLEIGPGRGAWSRAMLARGPQALWCMDLLSAEHNHFWQTVGESARERVHYLQVGDASCRDLPDDAFDFVFSFGAFCHMPWEVQSEYYRRLFPKLRRGAHGMIMFADYGKYNASIREADRVRTAPLRGDAMRAITSTAWRYLRGRGVPWPVMVEGAPNASSFHNGGIERTRTTLESIGWQVIESDVAVTFRDPIVHFRKP